MNTDMTKVFMTQSLVILGFVGVCALISSAVIESNPGLRLQKHHASLDLYSRQSCTVLQFGTHLIGQG
jgi:hypothetical protein